MMSTPELIQHADIVVVGKVTGEEGELILTASEVLKGRLEKKFTVYQEEGPFALPEVPVGKQGIYFLKKREKGYMAFHPASYKGMEELEKVKAVLKMFADPGPYLDFKESSENADLVYILGELFMRWRISSDEILSLPESMSRFADRYYQVGPWVKGSLIEVECRAQKDGYLTFLSAQPEGPLTQFFQKRLLAASHWDYVKKDLKPRFKVSLDTRLLKKVGSATHENATQYLRDQLRSTDVHVVTQALLALAKMRDSDSVPFVIDLLQHKDKQVRASAIQFLGWSRSGEAEKPLRKLLDTHAGEYPKNHEISDEAAISLGKIGAKESVSSLEKAACHGVQRAIEAMYSMGGTESFEILLKAAQRDPKRCAYMTNAFYWLVRRSNREIEPWMDHSTWNEKIGSEQVKKWTAWWKVNAKGFQVMRSQEEELKPDLINTGRKPRVR